MCFESFALFASSTDVSLRRSQVFFSDAAAGSDPLGAKRFRNGALLCAVFAAVALRCAWRRNRRSRKAGRAGGLEEGWASG